MCIFNLITIKNIFNSFLYCTTNYNGQNRDPINIKSSIFINILNTTIHIERLIFTNIIYENRTVNCDISSQNSCFINCAATGPSSNGGAICNDCSYGSINLISTVFSHCSSTGHGGAISSNGYSITLNSCIFYECRSGETGMAVIYNKNKFDGFSYFDISISQTRFSNNEGKHDLLDLDCNDIECVCSNFSYNKNYEHNQPSSAIQFCVCLPLISNQFGMNFRYNNLVCNDGDYLVSLDEKPDYSLTYFYVNFIENINLNYIFQFFGKIRSNIIFENFLFYGNKPYSDENGILIANKDAVDHFTFTNCIFDQNEEQVNSMLNSHSQTGGVFGITIGSGKGQTYTFEYAYSYTKPSKCFIPDEFLNFGTDFFTESEPFSNSFLFTSSNFFTPSNCFTHSNCFTFWSQFSKSKTFWIKNSFSKSESSFIFVRPTCSKINEMTIEMTKIASIKQSATPTAKKELFNLKSSIVIIISCIVIIVFSAVFIVIMIIKMTRKRRVGFISDEDSSICQNTEDLNFGL